MVTSPALPDRLIDITGLRSGELVVLQYMGRSKWLCRCDCGNLAAVHSVQLRNSKTRSCGHVVTAVLLERNTSHRRSGTREYAAWGGMLTRCTNPNSKDFNRYGGRGISVCERWRTFENFLEDVGPKPSASHSLDRIDVNGNYEPGNVRWATLNEQAANKRRNRYLIVDGVKRLAIHVAKENGISSDCFDNRVNTLGWDMMRAATEPSQARYLRS